MRSTDSVIDSLGELSKKWLRPNFLYRKKAVLRMQPELLDSLFGELTSQKLKTLLKAELRLPKALDQFVRDPLTKTYVRARGPRQITHIFSSNAPNPAVLSFIFGIILRSRNIGKVSRRDPGILDLYLGSLKKHDPELAKSCFLIAGRGASRGAATLQKFINASDLVVAYGQEQTIKKFKEMTRPSARFIGYGPRVSFSIITRERPNISHALKDVWLTGQSGCLSPQVFFVRKNAREFARRLAKELDRMAEVETSTANATHRAIFDRYRMKQIKGERVGIWQAGTAKDWLIVYDEKPTELPSLSGSKTIYVKQFQRVEQIYKALAPLRGVLQAVSWDSPGTVPVRLTELGFNRVCRPGRMQKPPIAWHHDGMPNLANWVTWTDIEW